jgi:AcrR family transcriptional regulator
MKLKRSKSGFVANKSEIIRTAAKLFASIGYHATTIDDIAKELGITKPAIYYYIKSKEEILREIIGGMMEPLEKVAKIGRSDRPAKERLEIIIRMLTTYAAERKEITLIAMEQNNVLPKISQNALKRRQKEVDRVLQKILKEGIEEGTFTTDDIKITSYAISAAAIYIYRWYNPAGTFTPDQIADQFIHLLENGLIKKRTTSFIKKQKRR